MRRGSGFTLLEALAAVITLGLLAAAVVPMLRQLGRTNVAERIEAQAWLRAMPPLAERNAGPALAIPGHPGWGLVVGELVAGPEPPPAPGSPPPAGPAHRWLVVGIRGSGGETLAETLVAVMPP